MQKMTRDIRGNRGFRIALGFMLLAVCVLLPLKVKAEGIDFATGVAQLQAKFPQGKYWNHVGQTADNPDGWTDYPCTEHKTAGVDHIYGTGGCTCNHFVCTGHLLATQCMGFANKLGYDVFGDTTWTQISNPDATQIANIQIGDIVRLNNSHSVFVIGKNANVITVGEANYPNSCQINWNRQIDLFQNTVTYYEHANNYESVMASGIQQPTTPQQPATPQQPEGEQPAADPGDNFTGWRLAADNQHYQYFKAGQLQTGKWLTISKKKYYVDESGYRVTGLYKIQKKTYYFNGEGVMQKKKWVTVGDDTYYVNEDGVVLLKQWLYYGNTLVYVTADGSIARDELVKINGNTYYFNKKGKRSKGFKKVNGKYYYCNSSGIVLKKQWVKKGGKSYYLQKSGVRAQNKLLKIGAYKYYFNAKGQMVKKKNITWNGKRYKIDKYGHCKRK